MVIRRHQFRFSEKTAQSATKALNQGILNVEWNSRYRSSMIKWLLTNVEDPTDDGSKRSPINLFTVCLLFVTITSIWFLH